MELVFATNNQHKIEEIQAILGNKVNILSMNDVGINEDIPEEQPTLERNAQQKALYIYNKYGYSCFADDTGLEIEALDNEPGVLSARYAGESKNADDNMNKVLQKLQNVPNRKARFRTVIHLVLNGDEHQFEGIVEGEITKEKKGNTGFGYDPIFKPKGYNTTFAEMGLDEKNKISHRYFAVQHLVDYLKQLHNR